MKLSPNLHEICHDHNCLEGSVLAKTVSVIRKNIFFFANKTKSILEERNINLAGKNNDLLGPYSEEICEILAK